MASTNPSSEDAVRLFQDIEQIFPHVVGGERWQILAVSVQNAIDQRCDPDYVAYNEHRSRLSLVVVTQHSPRISIRTSSTNPNTRVQLNGRLWSDVYEKHWSSLSPSLALLGRWKPYSALVTLSERRTKIIRSHGV